MLDFARSIQPSSFVTAFASWLASPRWVSHVGHLWSPCTMWRCLEGVLAMSGRSVMPRQRVSTVCVCVCVCACVCVCVLCVCVWVGGWVHVCACRRGGCGCARGACKRSNALLEKAEQCWHAVLRVCSVLARGDNLLKVVELTTSLAKLARQLGTQKLLLLQKANLKKI
jgi:hypothetical protein